MAFINTNMSGHNRLEFNEGPGLRVIIIIISANFFLSLSLSYSCKRTYFKKEIDFDSSYLRVTLFCKKKNCFQCAVFEGGPLLQVVGSQVEILRGGLVSFIGNNAESREGGALFMQDFGQIKLHSNSSMEFINNTGR